jgi:glucan phosphoethanolaminetransferase (alkaline phosphatase superfamily)
MIYKELARPRKWKLKENTKPTNVVVIMLESVQWQRTSLSPKVPRNQTPWFQLQSKAEDVYSFEKYYTTIPNTNKAMYSTLCGIMPAPGPLFPEFSQPNFLHHCLPKVLGDLG